MTGGSLPAMTFKKLMDYAHQGIDLKAIPGVDQPMPEKEAQPEVADAANPDALPPMVRPRSLSAQSTRLIRDLAARLKAADALSAPAGTAQAAAEPATTGATTR
jgi:penicillin-binding protein 1A